LGSWRFCGWEASLATALSHPDPGQRGELPEAPIEPEARR
jgi:hypothetical protein